MKKHIYLFALLLGVVLALHCETLTAQKVKWRRTEPAWSNKNSISFTFSPFGYTYDNFNILPVSLEYDRFFTERLSWGLLLYSSTIAPKEGLHSLIGKINCALPIVKNLLYFRFSFGVGLGYYQAYYSGCKDCSSINYECSLPYEKNTLKCNLLIDTSIVIRVNRKVDMIFSPLVIMPSRLIYALGSFSSPNYESYMDYDFMGKLGVGIRF